MRMWGAVRPRLPWVVAGLVMATLSVDSAVLADRQQPVARAPRVPVSVAVEQKVLPETEAEAAQRKRERDDAVRAMFDRRAKAVLARDRAAFLADLDAADPDFLRRQGELFDSLAKLDFASWEYRLRDETYSLTSIDWSRYRGAHDVVLPVQTLHYQLEDFDKRPVVRRVVYTVVRRGTRWTIGNDRDLENTTSTGTSTRRDPWENGPIVVARSANSLVIGHPEDASEIDGIQREVESAVKHVSSYVGKAWGERTVVILPGDDDELQRILESPQVPFEFAAIAASESTTLNEDNTPGQFAGTRVVINPANFNASSSFNRLLIRHELTHVALAERDGPLTPRWLSEGMAEWVAHSGSDLPTMTLAGPLPELVEEEGVPDYLPLDSDFGYIGEAGVGYASGWLLCRYIAQRWGTKKLLEFFDEMGSTRGLARPGEKLNDTLFSVLKIDEAALLRAWRPYVKAAVGSPEQLLLGPGRGYEGEAESDTLAALAKQHQIKPKQLTDADVERVATGYWMDGDEDAPDRIVVAYAVVARDARHGDKVARLLAGPFAALDPGTAIPGGLLYRVGWTVEGREYHASIAIVRSGLVTYEIRVLYASGDPGPEARRLAAAQLKSASSG